MKRLILFLATAIVMALTVEAQTPFFKKCENAKGVTTVFITKAMLEMAGDIQGIGISDKSLLKEKIDNTQIVTADTSEGCAYVSKHLGLISASEGYDMLMQINEKNENVKIFRRSMPEGKTSYVVVNKIHGKITVIIIEGSLSIEDIMRCVKH